MVGRCRLVGIGAALWNPFAPARGAILWTSSYQLSAGQLSGVRLASTSSAVSMIAGQRLDGPARSRGQAVARSQHGARRPRGRSRRHRGEGGRGAELGYRRGDPPLSPQQWKPVEVSAEGTENLLDLPAFSSAWRSPRTVPPSGVTGLR